MILLVSINEVTNSLLRISNKLFVQNSKSLKTPRPRPCPNQVSKS